MALAVSSAQGADSQAVPERTFAAVSRASANGHGAGRRLSNHSDRTSVSFDKPLHGEIKLPGQASRFYEGAISQRLHMRLEAAERLRREGGKLDSRKLRCSNIRRSGEGNS